MSGSGMATHRSARLLRLVLAALFVIGLAGCETLDNLNPFQEKKTPLPGERKPVFSSGVPGVEFNAPPQQPSNSNVQIQPFGASENPDRPVAEPGSSSAAQSGPSAKQPAAKAASKSAPNSASQSAPKPAPKSAAKPASDDPWADQR
jgi:hypothetical protein